MNEIDDEIQDFVDLLKEGGVGGAIIESNGEEFYIYGEAWTTECLLDKDLELCPESAHRESADIIEDWKDEFLNWKNLKSTDIGKVEPIVSELLKLVAEPEKYNYKFIDGKFMYPTPEDEEEGFYGVTYILFLLEERFPFIKGYEGVNRIFTKKDMELTGNINNITPGRSLIGGTIRIQPSRISSEVKKPWIEVTYDYLDRTGFPYGVFVKHWDVFSGDPQIGHLDGQRISIDRLNREILDPFNIPRIPN